MGEKNTQIVFGCFNSELKGQIPVGTDPDKWEDWGEWLKKHPRAEWIPQNSEGWSALGLAGEVWATSYESQPPWMGFLIRSLEYGDVALISQEEFLRDHAAWEVFRAILAEVGVEAPRGRVIIAHDE